jgi:hypothetical protein
VSPKAIAVAGLSAIAIARDGHRLRIHREGLKRIMRSDRHDRADTWYVFSDGSNVEEMVADALRAIRETGLSWLEVARGDAVRDYESQVREGLV